MGSLTLLETFVRSFLFEVKPRELIRSTSKKIVDRSGDIQIDLSRVDRKNSVWTFFASGSEGKVYTVKIKVPQISKRSASEQDVRVSCDCDFFRWQGPEHWGATQGYLYRSPRGTATLPSVRDPNQEKKLCKHAVAALEKFESLKL